MPFEPFGSLPLGPYALSAAFFADVASIHCPSASSTSAGGSPGTTTASLRPGAPRLRRRRWAPLRGARSPAPAEGVGVHCHQQRWFHRQEGWVDRLVDAKLHGVQWLGGEEGGLVGFLREVLSINGESSHYQLQNVYLRSTSFMFFYTLQPVTIINSCRKISKKGKPFNSKSPNCNVSRRFHKVHGSQTNYINST